jgi:hypothetical protein
MKVPRIRYTSAANGSADMRRIDRNTFEAFDSKNRPLGSFRTRARALAAIRKAWARFAGNDGRSWFRHPRSRRHAAKEI